MVIALFFNLRYKQKKSDTIGSTLVFSVLGRIFFSVCCSESSLHKDWGHCFMWFSKLTSMAFLFNRFIFSGAIVCVLCYGKSGTRIYIVSCILTFPTPKVSPIHGLVTTFECGERCRCVYLHWSFHLRVDHAIASLCLHKPNISKKLLRIAYLIIWKKLIFFRIIIRSVTDGVGWKVFIWDQI